MPIRRAAVYRTALTSSGALEPDQRVAGSYERLEFLGDAVLAVVTRHKLMRAFPDEAEVTTALDSMPEIMHRQLFDSHLVNSSGLSLQGFLSRAHDAMVSGRALASYGRHLKLERYMLANGISMLKRSGAEVLLSERCLVNCGSLIGFLILAGARLVTSALRTSMGYVGVQRACAGV